MNNDNTVSRIITATDPLAKAQDPRVIALFRALKGALPEAIPTGILVEALKVMLADVLRVQFKERGKAHEAVDKHAHEIKVLVALHYNMLGRRDEGGFAYDQTIRPAHTDFRRKN